MLHSNGYDAGIGEGDAGKQLSAFSIRIQQLRDPRWRIGQKGGMDARLPLDRTAGAAVPCVIRGFAAECRMLIADCSATQV